jgi:LmbE family N-acetylglucosaminyl deacetylase
MTFGGRISRALVVAPHADDEVLGCGGTIARLADAGTEVHVAVVTKGKAPRFAADLVEQIRAETVEAHRVLGVARAYFLDFPAAELDTISHTDLNQKLGTLVADVRPETLLIPFNGDVHLDHQLVFASSLVAARPNRADYPTQIWAYETLSETNWHAPYLTPGFLPNVYVDIAATLERKLAAMRCFASQVRPFPSERSLEALEALARLRGASVHRQAAEAFVAVRQVF